MGLNKLGKWAFSLVASCLIGFFMCPGVDDAAAEGTGGHANPTGAHPSETHPRARRISCATALDEAEAQRRSAHLRDAQDTLLECAQSNCNRRLKASCLAIYLRLQNDVPSLVPVVVDEAGAPLVDVEVKLDGKPVASRLDGRAIPVDPGVHELAFEKDCVVFANRTVMAAQGQRNRPIAATFRRSSVANAGKAGASSDSASRIRKAPGAKPAAAKGQPLVPAAGKGQKEPAADKTMAKPTPAVARTVPASH